VTDQYLCQNAELPQCPVETTLEVISTRWGALIVRDLLNGPLRYKELQRSLGDISQKVLTENLRQLEARGILTRTVYEQVPPRVEYKLTELGQSIERTILCGHPTLSRPISALLARTDVQHAYYAPWRASWYEPGTRAVREIDSPAELEAFALMGSGVRADDAWLDAWVAAGQRAQEASLTLFEAYRCTESETVQPQASIPSEECNQYGAYTSQPARIPAQTLALQTWNTCAQQRRTLVVGSSSIVRDLDIIAPALGADAPARVLANRGLSGIDGLIFKNGDANDLKEKLEMLLKDENLRQKLAKNASESANLFSKENIIKQWREFIKKVVSK